MLSGLERKIASWSLASVILVGFLSPQISEALAPFTQISLFLLIVTSLLPLGRLQVNSVFSLDGKIWQIVTWQLLVLPAIILSAAHLARLDSDYTILMITTAAAGSLFASPTFAELLQVNKQRALQCMILSNFLMPVSYFVFFTIVLHSQINLDVTSLIHRCMTFLVMPLGILLVYMGIANAIPSKVADVIEGASRRSTIIALIVFELGRIGPAHQLFVEDTRTFVFYLIIVSALGVGMAYLTAVVMFRQGISDSVTASIVSGFRNVGLGFVLLSGTTLHGTAEYVGVAQIPVCLAPLMFALFIRSRSSLARTESDPRGELALAA